MILITLFGWLYRIWFEHIIYLYIDTNGLDTYSYNFMQGLHVYKENLMTTFKQTAEMYFLIYRKVAMTWPINGMLFLLILKQWCSQTLNFNEIGSAIFYQNIPYSTGIKNFILTYKSVFNSLFKTSVMFSLSLCISLIKWFWFLTT